MSASPTFYPPDQQGGHVDSRPATLVATNRSGPNSISSGYESSTPQPETEVTDGPMGTNNNCTQVTLTETINQSRQNTTPPASPKVSGTMFVTPERCGTREKMSRDPPTRQDTLSTTMSPSSIKQSMTFPSGLKKSITFNVTPVKSHIPPEKSQSRIHKAKLTIQGWHNAFGMQLSMIGLAALGFLTALAHHLYNSSLNGNRIHGDPQWPPRFGSAMAFFVKLILISSVQIAYKQQAWLAVKKQSLKVSTLDAIFAVYHDPFQFANLEFLFKTTLPAILAAVSWGLPLCAIASPSTLTSESGYETTASNCPNIPVMNFTREIDYTLDGADDDLSGLAYWNFNADGDYYYDEPSNEMQRIFTLSTLSTTGPLQQENPCPSGTNCTYSISFFAPAYGCEERDEFGGAGQQYTKSQLGPNGSLLYASYSSLPMGPEDEGGAPLSWTYMNDTDPMLGVFTGLPSLWVGWCTATPTPESYWANLVPHVAECQMYNATYSFDLTFSNGVMSVNGSSTELHNLLLPNGTQEGPTALDYLEFGSYHATGFLLRNFLQGNVSLANDTTGDTYAITNSDVTQTTLLDPSTQLPTGGDDLAASVSDYYRDVFVSMLSDVNLHDRQLSNISCSVTSSVQVWKYEPFWLVLPYAIAVGVTFIILLVGLHGFIMNGYAADASFSTFIVTSRSKDLDALSKGSCLGQWPKEKELLESRLKFGEIETDGTDPHASFAFPENVKEFDKRKKFIPEEN